MPLAPRPVSLSVAGFDPSHFAGCSADLRTFHSLGVAGLAATTTVTAQSPNRFSASFPVNSATLSSQLSAISSEFGPVPTKIGLLASLETVRCLADFLSENPPPFAVLDPILSATAGPGATNVSPDDLAQTLFPRVSLITPNIPEAERLLNCSITTLADMSLAATTLFDTFGCHVLLKGGHLPDPSKCHDVYFDGCETVVYEAFRSDQHSIHGSGCFLSAAIAAYSALGFPIKTAIGMAKTTISSAFQAPYLVQRHPLLAIPSS